MKQSKRIVIDASIARSAGGEDVKKPMSSDCRKFLMAILNICHHIVLTKDISKEWNKHQSNFTRKWRKSMAARKKIFKIEKTKNQPLRDKIKKKAEFKEKMQCSLKRYASRRSCIRFR